MFTVKYKIPILKKSIKKDYEFKYDCDTHTIDINTLLASQFHFTAILQEIKTQLYPDLDLSIKVKAFEKGSFDVNQIIEITTVTSLFALENISYSSNIFSIVSGYITVKSFLKDKKATKTVDKGTKIEIYVSGNDNSIIVEKDAFNIYQNNEVINNAFKHNGKALDTDVDIENIIVTDKQSDNVVVRASKDDFENMTTHNPYLDSELKDKTKKVFIGILKWETIPKKGSKWSFVYENRKINQVAIKDDVFLKRILNEKLRFGAGDKLEVDLLIKMKKDEHSGLFLEDKFEVLHVHDIKWRSEQSSLF